MKDWTQSPHQPTVDKILKQLLETGLEQQAVTQGVAKSLHIATMEVMAIQKLPHSATTALPDPCWLLFYMGRPNWPTCLIVKEAEDYNCLSPVSSALPMKVSQSRFLTIKHK